MSQAQERPRSFVHSEFGSDDGLRDDAPQRPVGPLEAQFILAAEAVDELIEHRGKRGTFGVTGAIELRFIEQRQVRRRFHPQGCGKEEARFG